MWLRNAENDLSVRSESCFLFRIQNRSVPKFEVFLNVTCFLKTGLGIRGGEGKFRTEEVQYLVATLRTALSYFLTICVYTSKM